jgi:AcrR family transcriptional regulator
MSARTVDWVALRTPRGDAGTAEGLRERKKRRMRQQLTDTATEMFVARGFDAVRVSEIAEACGVSEKTVFNYFPTKESLILDHSDSTMATLRSDLADPTVAPVRAALRILADELGGWIAWLDAQPDKDQAVAKFRGFAAVIQSTPSLRAYQREMLDRLIAAAAEVLADRAGLDPADPEPQIAANALLGLWRVQFRGMARYLDGTQTSAEVQAAITADVRRAANVIEAGLATFPATTGM